MKRPWFRMHARVKDDAKIQRLPAELFKVWVNLCCLACENDGHLPSVESIAYTLHKSAETTLDSICKLTEVPFKLIDRNSENELTMHDWDEWQYQSDVSTQRVRKFRASKEELPRNVSETLHETTGNVSETDQKQRQRQKESVSTKTVETDGVFALESAMPDKPKRAPKERKPANSEWPDWKRAAWIELLRNEPNRLKCAGAKPIFESAVQSPEQAEWLITAQKSDLAKNGAGFRTNFRNWLEGAITVMDAGISPEQTPTALAQPAGREWGDTSHQYPIYERTAPIDD